jgi:hypothetical protein
MKEVEFFRWQVPDDRRPGKLRPTSYRMTREQAAEAFPGAKPDEATREVRMLPEDAHEVGRMLLLHGGGRPKT